MPQKRSAIRKTFGLTLLRDRDSKRHIISPKADRKSRIELNRNDQQKFPSLRDPIFDYVVKSFHNARVFQDLTKKYIFADRTDTALIPSRIREWSHGSVQKSSTTSFPARRSHFKSARSIDWQFRGKRRCERLLLLRSVSRTTLARSCKRIDSFLDSKVCTSTPVPVIAPPSKLRMNDGEKRKSHPLSLRTRMWVYVCTSYVIFAHYILHIYLIRKKTIHCETEKINDTFCRKLY